MRSVRAAVVAAALLVACGASLLEAPPAAAAGVDQFQDNALVTYQLLPARHTIHVTVKVTMANKKPSVLSSNRCTGWAFDPYYGWYSYSTTCTYKTNYYYFSSSYWVEADATNFTVKASSGSAKLKARGRDGNWRLVTITFSRLYYGQTRSLTYAYDLPASGPRGTTTRLAGAVRAHFCAVGPGSDSGEVRIVLPAGYELDNVAGLRKISSSGSTWMWTSGALKTKPWTWTDCITGANPLGVTSTPVTDADNPIGKIVAWKDDAVWAAAAATATADTAKLAAVLGQHPDGGGIVLAEATSATPFNSYQPSAKTLAMTEQATTVAEFDDAIAQTWLPATVFGVGWIRAGYVRWAEAAAGVAGVTCSKPGAAPNATAANLDLWEGSYTGQSQGVVEAAAYQNNAACWIVSQVAEAIGADRMRATMDAMRSGAVGWSSGDRRPSTLLRWQDWLDIVTAQGLIPAGKDPQLAADLLTTLGIAKPTDGLDARSQAIQGYQALGETTGGKVPASILPAIAAWDFAAANKAIDTANRAWTTAGSVPSTLMGVTVSGGPVQQAVQNAKTQADLDAASTLADAQVALAKHVADAIALGAAPRDLVAQIGLAGTTLPSAKPAVDAVTTMDTATATTTADQISSAINGAHDVGVQRIEIAVGSLIAAIALLLLAVFLLRRRRHRRLAPVTVAAAAWAAPIAPITATPPPAPPVEAVPVGLEPATQPADEVPPPPPSWG